MLMNCSDTDTAPVCHQPVRRQDDLAFDTAGAVSNRCLPRLYRFRSIGSCGEAGQPRLHCRWDLALRTSRPNGVLVGIRVLYQLKKPFIPSRSPVFGFPNLTSTLSQRVSVVQNKIDLIVVIPWSLECCALQASWSPSSVKE